MRKAWLALPIVACAVAFVGPAASSSADENVFGKCPDGYTATPVLFSTTEDKNGNGVVCVKLVAGHVNDKDDPNGKPYECNGTEAYTNPDCIEDVTDDIIIDA